MDEKKLRLLDFMILKQAVRDCASKDQKLVKDSTDWFSSEDFKELCIRNEIDDSLIIFGIKELLRYPLISRKKYVNKIANIIDKRTT